MYLLLVGTCPVAVPPLPGDIPPCSPCVRRWSLSAAYRQLSCHPW